MISDNLFREVLVLPSTRCNQLKIISGYASPAMANKHLSALRNNVSISLVVGMTSQDGMGLGGHNGFKSICTENALFQCNYVVSKPPVHTKSYIWLKDNEPIIAYTGSGNYSQNAFFGGTSEAFAEDDPIQCNKLFTDVMSNSSSCLDPNIETLIVFYEEIYRRKSLTKQEILNSSSDANDVPDNVPTEECVTLSLLSSRDGQTHNQSGLNWGQRYGREPNQAYIPIPSQIAKSGFFPNRANHFTMITDDGVSLDCAVAQDGDKAIHTTKSNSIMGRYFRKRLGVADGEYVTTDHLRKYGRTDVRVCKIDNETYFLDFS